MPNTAANVSAPEMPEEIAALLPRVRRKPLPLARNGKTAAVLINIREYQKMADAVEFLSNYDGELSPAEERELIRQVEEARKEPPLGVEESRKLMESVLQAEAKALAKEKAKCR
ncbi:MAG: hypothetical protein HAW59_06075 [Betaproteobacteria bacterium]|nr:hypothetical protein [Betaproteobacteria bacterium]